MTPTGGPTTPWTSASAVATSSASWSIARSGPMPGTSQATRRRKTQLAGQVGDGHADVPDVHVQPDAAHAGRPQVDELARPALPARGDAGGVHEPAQFEVGDEAGDGGLRQPGADRELGPGQRAVLAQGPHQKREVPSAQTGLVRRAALAHRRHSTSLRARSKIGALTHNESVP